MKSKTIAISLACVLVLGGTVWYKTQYDQQKIVTTYNDADWITYRDKGSIVKASDVVIKGKVIKINDPIRIDSKIIIDDTMTEDVKKDLESLESYDICTVSDIEITKVIKGDFEVGDVIKVQQPGGKYKNEVHVWEDVVYYKKNDERVFFLEDIREEFGADTPFNELNPYQGSFKITKEKSRDSKGNGLFKDEKEVEEFVKGSTKTEGKTEEKPEVESEVTSEVNPE